MYRTYEELITFNTLKERFEYLKLSGVVGRSTFGFDRHLNQALYHSAEWISIRSRVITRDNGCDLAVPGYEVVDRIMVHHMNPISEEDILQRKPILFDMNNLITTSHRTHMGIHYSDDSLLPQNLIERHPGDTIPWKERRFNGR